MKRHSLTVALTIAWVLVGAASRTTFADPQFSEPVPNWIWSPEHAAGHIPHLACYFRRVVDLQQPTSGELAVAADDAFELFINGQRVGGGTSEQGVYTFDVRQFLRAGSNVIALRVSNRKGETAGLATRLVVQQRNQRRSVFVSDATWRTSLSVFPLWNRASYSDRRWQPAKSIGTFSDFVVRQQRDAMARANVQQSVAGNQLSTDDAVADRQSKVASVRPAAGARKLTKLPVATQHLDVPREFQLEQIAGHQDVGSLIAMTFNEAGQIIASRENGSLVLIDDQDKDGHFDSIRDYCQAVKGCQGILALNGQVFAVGMGPSGSALYRLSDMDHDGFLDKAQAIVKFSGENFEHGPHGLALGADGLLYAIVGNHSTVQGRFAETSPYRHAYEGDLIQPKVEDPGGHATGVKAPGGFILRTDSEGNQVEIVAGGLRNAYDLAFNAQGEIFAHDSDMESDEGTTWFRPTRLYHVTPGAEFGWRSGWSKWPDYFIDTLPGIADTGRGSPTGIVVYDHHGFPAGYRNRVFSCDWSGGRILMFNLHEEGSSYRATSQTFIRGEPLNVTDIDVGPDGALYFCTGGRGTAGNVYRVSWKGYDAQRDSHLGEGIDLALRQPQMNSSWGRQNIARVKQQLGDAWTSAITSAALDPHRPTQERAQAMRIMHWLDGTPNLKFLVTLSRDEDVAVRRQATYLLGMVDDAASSQQLMHLLRDDDPVVRRRACEALVRIRQVPSFDRLSHLFNASDRFELWSARRLLEQIPRRQWQDKVLNATSMNLFLHGATAILIADPDPEIATAILQRTFRLMDGFVNDDHFTSMLRVQQLALLRGQINPQSIPSLAPRTAREYPTSSQIINRELVRLLVYAQVSSIMDRYLKELESDAISPPDRYHLAMHLARLRSGWTTEQKLAVFRNLEAPSDGGSNLPGFLQAVALEFGKTLTTEEIAYFLENGHKWPNAALSALLRLPDQLSARQFEQIKSLDEHLADKTGETTKRLKIGIVAVLARDGSPPSLAYLRHIYQRDPARRVEIALGLAEHPVGENWDVLVRSLTILDDASAKQVLVRLKNQTRWPKTSEPYRNVILLAERLGENGAEDAIALLEHWQGFGASDQRLPWDKALLAWKSWYAESFPNDPAPEHSVTSQGGKWEYESLLRHLLRAEHEGTGSAERGRSVFVKAQCASCHRHADQGEAMGPDLTGVTRRFLKREILESIIYPSKVISDQYAARVVTTVDGRSYLGIVAHGAADELVVLMTNGQKIRIPETEIDEIEPSRTSAMPEGTLDQLTLDEITDLFAYLATSGRRLTQRSTQSSRE